MSNVPTWLNANLLDELVTLLVRRYGESVRARAEAGIQQVAALWREDDGDDTVFRAFITTRFVGEPSRYELLLAHAEDAVYHLRGHLHELHRALSRWRDAADYEDPGIDDLLAQFDPAPDLAEELYRSKLAFVLLLNFPRKTLAEKLAQGATWTPEQWAAARLADAIPYRIPRSLNDRARVAFHRAREFYYNFHIPVGCVVDEDGTRPFPRERKLLAHWLVREELRAAYGHPDAFRRQRLLARIMGRHVDGSIPRRVMAGEAQSWCPYTNVVDGADPSEVVGPERYAVWLDLFQLARAMDPYYPDFPTHLHRALTLENQLDVDAVEALLRSLLEAPVRTDVARFVAARLGRSLQAFDIYFNNVAPPEPIEVLNDAVARRFAHWSCFQAQLPELLCQLGFSADTAAKLATHIRTELARGSGHASPARLYEYPSILRTNHVDGRIDWHGFLTAMHELGHCIEQVLSLHHVPRPALIGVPNLGITEGFAFTFQSFARQVLGLPVPPHQSAIDTLNTFLTACEIAGAGLLDLLMWRWLYQHPGASAEELREATLACAQELWQRYYAPYFGPDDNHLLAAYQHMIGMMLYLPNYTIGHVIAHLVRRHLTPETLAREVERMCAQGNLTPDLWLLRAVGSPLSVKPLIDDTREALKELSNDRFAQTATT